MATYLYKRDSKEKVRVFKLEVIGIDDRFDLCRTTGLLGGAMVDQPIVSIDKGKAKRTVQEQAVLQATAIVNKQKDKGYKSFKDLTDGINLKGRLDPETDYDFIDSILPKGQTYANGDQKVMLALDPKTRPNFDWNEEWWVSKKLDGIRVSIHYDNKEFKAISRNGKDISPAFTHIFSNPRLKKLFKALGEGVVLDGELYKHGMPLQRISGISRLKEYTPERNDQLELWIFDFMHDTMTAEERITTLRKLDTIENDNIKIVAHTKLTNYEDIKKLHDVFILSGFEGAIARLASATYQFGKKNANMVKVKEFQDAEFKIVDYSEGLRPEDMCFVLVLPQFEHIDIENLTKEHTFEAKPMGTRELKEEYLENMDSIIGKMATVKFFNYTEDGKPFLPVLKAIRDYE